MRIAIIGSGISGLVCASRLHARHDIQIFEQEEWIGGHTHTVDVEHEGETYAVDTGFITYNERNYPNFSALLSTLGVETQPTRMTFGFRSERTGLEYAGTSINALFAQRLNLLRPTYWAMLKEILRFFREARVLVSKPGEEESLGSFLDRHGFSRAFQDDHLLPMGAAIWSCPPDQMRAFPARSFVKFFENHGLLRLRDRPEWRVVKGGSARYVETLTAPFTDRINLNCPVEHVSRHPDRVDLTFSGDHSAASTTKSFDAVVFACHSDQALALLSDASIDEKDTLSAIRYQPNDVALHTDESMLPRSPLARAAWNYHVSNDSRNAAAVTYDMNLLQGIDAPIRFLVTLNSTDAIDPAQIIERYRYDHPIFDESALKAQGAQVGLGENLRTAYCGAYWGYGFHEDGVRSGIIASDQIERISK